MKKLVHEVNVKEALKLPKKSLVETDNIEYATEIHLPERGKTPLTQLAFIRVPTHPPLMMIVTEPIENFMDEVPRPISTSGLGKRPPEPPVGPISGLSI